MCHEHKAAVFTLEKPTLALAFDSTGKSGLGLGVSVAVTVRVRVGVCHEHKAAVFTLEKPTLAIAFASTGAWVRIRVTVKRLGLGVRIGVHV